MARPYRLGKKKVDQADFDLEVKRLLALGLRENEIAKRLQCSRWPIGRAIKRLGKVQVTEAKASGAYVRLSHDEFGKLPEVQKFIGQLRAKRIANWHPIINKIKGVCDDLQIYPSMLDISWASKWLEGQESKDDNQLRSWRVALRGWLKFNVKASDSELAAANLGAKHYNRGKFATVAITPDQFLEFHKLVKGTELEFVADVGLDTCPRVSELYAITKDSFTREGENYIVNIPTGKTEKSGQSYALGWVRRHTYEIAMKLGNGSSGPIMKMDQKTACAKLRELYLKVGVTDDYGQKKPFHIWRHFGAMRYLALTNWNRAIVAKWGHWQDEATLEDHYGAIPLQNVFSMFQEISGKPVNTTNQLKEDWIRVLGSLDVEMVAKIV